MEILTELFIPLFLYPVINGGINGVAILTYMTLTGIGITAFIER